VLYEDHAAGDVGNDRDIFSVDDIALVVSDKVADFTPDQFVDFSVNGPGPFGFLLEISSLFSIFESDYIALKTAETAYEYSSDGDTAIYTAKMQKGNPMNDIIVEIEATGGFNSTAGTPINEAEFMSAISLVTDPTSSSLPTVFTSTNIIDDVVITSTYMGMEASRLTITNLTMADNTLLDSYSFADLVVSEYTKENVGYTSVKSTDNWSVEFAQTFTDLDLDGNINNEAIAEVLDVFNPLYTLII